MKTYNVLKRFVQVLALAVMTLGLANCSKDSGSSSSTRYQCYSYYNNQTVDNSYCVNSSYNNNYYNNNYYNNNQQYICRDTSTGSQVTNSLCSNSTIYTNGTGTCVGIHYGGNGQAYQCGNGYTDCGLNAVTGQRGVQLYNQAGQIVTCY